MPFFLFLRLQKTTPMSETIFFVCFLILIAFLLAMDLGK